MKKVSFFYGYQGEFVQNNDRDLTKFCFVSVLKWSEDEYIVLERSDQFLFNTRLANLCNIYILFVLSIVYIQNRSSKQNIKTYILISITKITSWNGFNG